MAGEIAEAAALAVVGIATVLSALAILMVATMVVMRVVQGRGEESKEIPEPEPDPDRERFPAGERVAVIAVAVVLAMQKEQAASPGRDTTSMTHAAVNQWQTAGRQRLMRSRKKAGRQWGRLQ